MECTYNRSYFDFTTGKEELFVCKNSVWKRNKCKFHSKHYLRNKTKNEIASEFDKLLNNAKKTGILKCIGYHLPTIELPKYEQEPLDVIVYFTDAKFHGKIDFTNIHFNKPISFTDAIFYETANFTKSTFSATSQFINTTFNGIVNSFQFTEFEKRTEFSYAKINNAIFSHAKFNESVFYNSTFYNKSSFVNSQFKDKCTFTESTFYESDFSESVFSKTVSFEEANFYKHAVFNNIECGEQIQFNGNVSNVSFLGVNIKKIKFGNQITWKKIVDTGNWTKIKSYLNWTRNNEFKIYDEIDLETRLNNWWKLEKNKETKLSLESIKNVYRDLRENFDLNLRYETSGEFHVREMELTRRYREKHRDGKITTVKRHVIWQHLSAYWAYNLLAQYGQSLHRPMYFAMTIILVATLYFSSNEIQGLIAAKLDYSLANILLKSFTRSIAGIIPFDILGTGITDVDKVLRVMLLPVSASFFIALKRRLERKFRH